MKTYIEKLCKKDHKNKIDFYLLSLPLILLFFSLPLSLSGISFSSTLFYITSLIWIFIKRRIILKEIKTKITNNKLFYYIILTCFLIILIYPWISSIYNGTLQIDLLDLVKMNLIELMYIFVLFLSKYINWKLIIKTFFISSLIAVSFSFITFFFGIPEVDFLGIKEHYPFKRTGGVYLSPPYIVGCLIILFYVLIAYIFSQKKILIKNQNRINILNLFSILYLILVFGAILLTQTRALWISLFVTVILFFVLNIIYLKKIYISIPFMIFLFFFVILIFIYQFPYNIPRIIPIENDLWQSINPREYIYKLGLDIGLENPLFGLGINGFEKTFIKEYYNTGLFHIKHWHSHNDFIHLFSIGGFPLFIAFFIFMITKFLFFFKTFNKNRLHYYFNIIIFCIFTSLFIYGMTDFIIISIVNGYIYWIILALIPNVNEILDKGKIIIMNQVIHKSKIFNKYRMKLFSILVTFSVFMFITILFYNNTNTENGHLYDFKYYIYPELEIDKNNIRIFIQSHCRSKNQLKIYLKIKQDKIIYKKIYTIKNNKWYPSYFYEIKLDLDSFRITKNHKIYISIYENNNQLRLSDTYYEYYFENRYWGDY